MVTVVFERDKGGIVARRINRCYSVTTKAMAYAVNYMSKNGINRLLVKYDEKTGEIFSCHESFPRLALIPSFGIIEEEGLSSVPSYALWHLALSLVNSLLCDVQVIDPNIMSTNSFREYFSRNLYDVIGLSVIPANLENDLRIASALRLMQPKSRFVIGGINSHVLFQFDVDKALDAEIIVGSGEEPLKRILASTIKRTVNFDNIQYMSSSFFEEGYPPVGGRDLVHDLCYVNDAVYVVIDNHCQHSCFWCSSPKNGPFFTSAYQVAGYLKNIIRNDCVNVVIADNDISFNSESSIELCQELIKQGVKNRKYCKSSLLGMNQMLLDELSRANFCKIAYGVESFDFKERQLLGKNIPDREVDDVLRNTIQQGIVPEINIILFSPFSSRSSLKKILEKSAYWLKKGAEIFCTLGLYAVPGFENNKVNYSIKRIDYPGLIKPVNIPYIYEIPSELRSMFENVAKKYRHDTSNSSKFPNNAKSVLKLKYASLEMGETVLADTFHEFFMKMKERVYINV